jgi:hypothetical protein
MPLFATVFHVWGKLNRTFTKGAESGGLLDYFDQYVKWDDPTKPNYLQVGFKGWQHEPGCPVGFGLGGGRGGKWSRSKWSRANGEIGRQLIAAVLLPAWVASMKACLHWGAR